MVCNKLGLWATAQPSKNLSNYRGSSLKKSLWLLGLNPHNNFQIDNQGLRAKHKWLNSYKN